MSDDKKAQPMDPSAKEKAVGTPAMNTERVCYALSTLVDEVLELFPETPVEYSNYDGRNTALDATFDLTADPDGDTLGALLGLLSSEPRVREVQVDGGTALVGMVSNPRTQDKRDGFGLADALEVLAEEDEYPWSDASEFGEDGSL